MIRLCSPLQQSSFTSLTLCICEDVCWVQKAPCWSVSPAVVCWAIHICEDSQTPVSCDELGSSITPAHVRTFNIYRLALQHTHTYQRALSREDRAGWCDANGSGVSMVTKPTEGTGGPPPDPHWVAEWLPLSQGKIGSRHNTRKRNESDQQPCKPITAVGHVSCSGQSEALNISIRKTLC